MPGHNHYRSCICGWCYKTGSNGYSPRRSFIDHDTPYAKRKLKEHGADRSWTACFVVPNASCPVCFAKVYYYQNKNGSRVFFNELGWPWDKHSCTDNATPAVRARGGAPELLVDRKRGAIAELLEAAQTAAFDPNATFRNKYGHSPFDLLKVLEFARRGFENFIEAQSISPPLNDPVFLTYTSAKNAPRLSEYFSFSGTEVYFLNEETVASKKFKAKVITGEEFAAVCTPERP